MKEANPHMGFQSCAFSADTFASTAGSKLLWDVLAAKTCGCALLGKHQLPGCSPLMASLLGTDAGAQQLLWRTC